MNERQETDYSLIVPVFNNEGTLKQLWEKLDIEFERIRLNLNLVGEVIFIVDGSPDQSLQLLRKLKLVNARDDIRILEFSRNFGQTAAILAGLSNSVGKVNIVMSADLQDPTELIEEMLKYWQTGNDLVICTRKTREDSWVTRLTSRIAHQTFKYFEPNMPIGGFDYFLISKQASNRLIEIAGRFRFLQGDVLSLGFKRAFIPYHRNMRIAGKSSYTFGMRLKLFVDSIFESARFPIRSTFAIGSVFFFSGLIVASSSLLNYINDASPFNGFTAIFCSILVLGGIQVFLLGIIGQFVYRNFDLGRNKHLYILKEIY